MYKRAIVYLFAAIVLIGCQANPEQAEAVDESPPVNAAEVETSRPDPQVPSGENNEVPEDWIVRLDRPNPDVVIGSDNESADIYFVNMTPGWHITSGPSGIYYHPASTAKGTYEAMAGIHLFDPGNRNEAFGIFIGGESLDAPGQAYDYFLIRNSGEYLIKRRRGEQTELIQDWTAHEAITRFTSDSESSVLNTLSIRVSEGEVGFLINDVKVTSIAASDIKTEGIVGLRVNHALNIHVSDLSVNNQEG